MKVDFTFIHVDRSESLIEYARDRIEKISKFELKPMDVHFQVWVDGHECVVEVGVVEGRRKFKATGRTDDFYRSVETVVNRLVRQMSKDKRRLKHHKNAEASVYGKIERLTETLEVDYSQKPLRKAS